MVVVGLVFALAGSYYLLKSKAATTSTNTVTTLSGQLELVHGENFDSKKDVNSFFVRTASGERVEIDFQAGAPKNVLAATTGANISVSGQPKPGNRFGVGGNDTIRVTSKKNKLIRSRKVVVMLVSTSENPVKPYTPAQIKNEVFTGTNSVNSFYKENSNNKFSIAGIKDKTGDVLGWYEVKSTATACDYYAATMAALDQAKQAGQDMDQYDNIIFFMPNYSCSYGGLGQVGGRFSWTFSYASLQLFRSITMHEFGHNLGVWHANSLLCYKPGTTAPVPISGECQHQEYGDPYDVMGYNIYQEHPPHLNNAFKRELDFIPETQLQTVNTTGTYRLYKQEADSGSGKRAIRIPVALKPLGYNSLYSTDYYYIEYRQPYGQYDNFAVTDPVVKGINIRRVNSGFGFGGTELLHNNPLTAAPFPLVAGQTFTDSTNKISIKLTSKNSTYATIDVVATNTLVVDATPPTAPATISSVAPGSARVELKWAPSSSTDTNYYEVYRNDIPSFSTTTPGFVDTFVEPLQQYTYKVRAVDAWGNYSEFSPVTTITTPAKDTIAPTRPTGLGVVSTTGSLNAYCPNLFKFKWSASTDNKLVRGYTIYKNDGKGYYWIGEVMHPETTYTDTCATSGAVTYKISAYDDDHNRSSSYLITTVP